LRRSFRLVEPEDLADAVASPGSLTALGGRLRYTALLPTEALSPDAACLVGTDALADRIRHEWAEANRPGHPMPAGVVALEGLVALGRAGLLLDMAGHCLVGGLLSFGRGAASVYLDGFAAEYRLDLAWSADRTEFSLDLPERMPRLPSPATLMCGPGMGIYGHWLLDQVPRLHLLGLCEAEGTSRRVHTMLPPWSRPLAAALARPGTTDEMIPTQPFRYLQHNLIPSGIRRVSAFSAPVCRQAWQALRHALLAQPAEAPKATRLYVTRRHWARQGTEPGRAIGNVAALEAMAEQRGYLVLAPETLSVPAQARLFDSARVVVGEDGSALHNILFARPGAALGVLGGAGRRNPWHLAMCRELGHRIGYVAAEPASGLIEPAAFAALLDQLEAVVSPA